MTSWLSCELLCCVAVSGREISQAANQLSGSHICIASGESVPFPHPLVVSFDISVLGEWALTPPPPFGMARLSNKGVLGAKPDFWRNSVRRFEE